MRPCRFLDRKDDSAQFGRSKPVRDVPTQHSALRRAASSAAGAPLPVMTSTSLAPSSAARQRKLLSARCACAWVIPCRSSTSSTCAFPAPSRRFRRFSNGASGGVDFGFFVGSGRGATERRRNCRRFLGSDLRRRRRFRRPRNCRDARPDVGRHMSPQRQLLARKETGARRAFDLAAAFHSSFLIGRPRSAFGPGAE